MDTNFIITLADFNKGQAPLSHVDSTTFIGASGQASTMEADIISQPGYLTQSPALVDLVNGNEDGVIDQLIRSILETSPDNTSTFAVGTSKLFKLNATTVVSGGTPSWPQSIASMTSGESIARINDNIFIFYNTATAGDIATMPIATEVIDNDWGSTTAEVLENAPHPSATKEDILVFGNGRYMGTYIEGLATLNTQQLDFGEGAQVVDIVFLSGYWWIAVNYGDRKSNIYMYDGSALSNILSDETGLGMQEIGFLYVLNGVVYVAFSDSTSSGYSIGYLSGHVVKPLRYFSGSLPDHRQKTLYKNTILFISGGNAWSFGATIEQLPAQISKLVSGGYDTVGALSAPFGTPLIASTDGDGGFRLAKFSGYSVDSNWKGINIDVASDRGLGKVHTVIVYTKPLGANAKATIKLTANQGSKESSEFAIQTTGQTRHVFRSIDLPIIEDVSVTIDYSEGNSVNDCPIRKIVLLGNFVES